MEDVWGVPMETDVLQVKIPNTIVASEDEKSFYRYLENILQLSVVWLFLAGLYLWKKGRISKFYTLWSFI